jgi:hypothetical protein
VAVAQLDSLDVVIIGAHSIIYSTNAEADRAFLRDVVKLTSVDVGDGWLIFGLPPAEVAVHPSEKNDVHEFYLMCDDLEGFITELARHGIRCNPVQDEGYGLVTQLTLPRWRQARSLSAPAREARDYVLNHI